MRPDVIHVATPGPVGPRGARGRASCSASHSSARTTPSSAPTRSSSRGTCSSRRRSTRTCSGSTGSARSCSRRRTRSPTTRRPAALLGPGAVWGRGSTTERFSPSRRDPDLRARLLGGGEHPAALGRSGLGGETARGAARAFAQLRAELPGVRLGVVGDGPARESFERGGRRRDVPRRAARRRVGARLRERRRLLLPEHDRHLRPGPSRGFRLGAPRGRGRLPEEPRSSFATARPGCSSGPTTRRRFRRLSVARD